MRICVIGNSHVGALKRAWNSLQYEHNGIQFTFFAARANGMSNLEYSNRQLIPNNRKLKDLLSYTSGGLESISIDDFDTFLIIGLGASPYYKQHEFYSQAVSGQALQDLYTTKLFYRIITDIRKASDKKIFLGHTPLPSKPSYESGSLDEEALKEYVDGIAHANSCFFETLNCRLVHQPLTTITGKARHTLFEYSKGSKRLDISVKQTDNLHPEADLKHMNDVYGGLYIKEFLARELALCSA